MNRLLLVAVALVLFIHFGGKRVPKILKDNKKMIYGITIALVLCSFFGNNIEGGPHDGDVQGTGDGYDVTNEGGKAKGKPAIPAEVERIVYLKEVIENRYNTATNIGGGPDYEVGDSATLNRFYIQTGHEDKDKRTVGKDCIGKTNCFIAVTFPEDNKYVKYQVKEGTRAPPHGIVNVPRDKVTFSEGDAQALMGEATPGGWTDNLDIHHAGDEQVYPGDGWENMESVNQNIATALRQSEEAVRFWDREGPHGISLNAPNYRYNYLRDDWDTIKNMRGNEEMDGAQSIPADRGRDNSQRSKIVVHTTVYNAMLGHWGEVLCRPQGGSSGHPCSVGLDPGLSKQQAQAVQDARDGGHDLDKWPWSPH